MLQAEVWDDQILLPVWFYSPIVLLSSSHLPWLHNAQCIQLYPVDAGENRKVDAFFLYFSKITSFWSPLSILRMLLSRDLGRSNYVTASAPHHRTRLLSAHRLSPLPRRARPIAFKADSDSEPEPIAQMIRPLRKHPLESREPDQDGKASSITINFHCPIGTIVFGDVHDPAAPGRSKRPSSSVDTSPQVKQETNKRSIMMHLDSSHECTEDLSQVVMCATCSHFFDLTLLISPFWSHSSDLNPSAFCSILHGRRWRWVQRLRNCSGIMALRCLLPRGCLTS